MVTFYFVSIVIKKNERNFFFSFLIIFQIAKIFHFIFKTNSNFLRMESNSASSLKDANQICRKDSGIIKKLTNWFKEIFNLKSGLNLNHIFILEYILKQFLFHT